jgi:hypothetical protein
MPGEVSRRSAWISPLDAGSSGSRSDKISYLLINQYFRFKEYHGHLIVVA